MWWYEEDFKYISKRSWQELNEFMSTYSDTLYDKQQIQTSWADERIVDEEYGMNNEWFDHSLFIPYPSSDQADQSSKLSVE